jgi:putative hydrolase of the HAD superfamily
MLASALMMPIRAITFDVGGTLIEPWPSVGHVYAEIARRHGVKNISEALLNARFKAAWQAETNFTYTREAWAGLVDQTFHGRCIESPSKTFFAELYDHFAEPVAWRIFDDVLPVLDELATKGVRLGLISNWDERLRILLKKTGLENYFESIVISCEVGFAKPSPIIFDEAARKLGLAPASVLHIGDSFAMDVQGARSAGLEALLVRRGAAACGDHELTSLAELPAWLLGHKAA